MKSIGIAKIGLSAVVHVNRRFGGRSIAHCLGPTKPRSNQRWPVLTLPCTAGDRHGSRTATAMDRPEETQTVPKTGHDDWLRRGKTQAFSTTACKLSTLGKARSSPSSEPRSYRRARGPAPRDAPGAIDVDMVICGAKFARTARESNKSGPVIKLSEDDRFFSSLS